MANNSVKKASKIILILSLIIAVISLYILFTVDLPNKPLSGQGGLKQDQSALIGGKFDLTDHHQQPFSSQQMLGKLSLVYFGFTFCPDICPTSLHKLAEIITTLDKYQIDILPLFITIDPSRDQADLLKEYLGHFHPKILGLTGSEAEIRKVADLYKVYYAKSTDSAEKDDKYMIDHSSFLYLMGKDGNYIKHFYLTDSAADIIEFIRRYNFSVR